MKRQLTIFDIQRQDAPEVGALVAGETISGRKPVRGRFERLSASGEWLIRDFEGKLRMCDRTTCEVLPQEPEREVCPICSSLNVQESEFSGWYCPDCSNSGPINTEVEYGA